MIFSLPSHLSIPIALLRAVLCPPALVVVVPAAAGDSEPSGSGTPSSCLGGCGYCFTGASCIATALRRSRFGGPRGCKEGPGSLIPGIPVGGGY
jgi:hypothetical protein